MADAEVVALAQANSRDMQTGGEEFSGEERRQSRRRPSPVNRLIRAELSADPESSEAVYLYLVDMSEGGFRINADRPLPPETPVALCFGLEGFPAPPSPKLAVTVQRAWDKTLVEGTWVSGLRFVDLSPEALATVQGLLKGFTPDGKRQQFRLREPISVSLQLKEEGPWVVVVPMDLSLSGVRVRAYLQVEPGSTVGLMLRLPEQKGHVFQGRVQEVKSLGPDRQEIGLTFVDAPTSATEAIQAYIDRVCGVPLPGSDPP